METKAFFEPATSSMTYVVFDAATKDAVVIDPVLDFEPVAAQTDTKAAREVVAFVREHDLRVHWVIETHAHADHLSASQFLKRELGARLAIGEKITLVQETFRGILDLRGCRCDGSQFDRLLRDGEMLEAGSVRIEVLATPGHTPACITLKIEDALYTGDTLFIEDYGTGRCDFPHGSARELYRSVHRLYALPDTTRVFVGHDYQPGGRALRYETTIGAEKQKNVHLSASTPEEDFVQFRRTRDATLTPPRLLFQAVQVNIDGGRLPAPRENGKRYLVTPLNDFRATDDVGCPLAANR